MSEMTALEKELTDRGVNEINRVCFVVGGGYLIKNESGYDLIPDDMINMDFQQRIFSAWPNYDYIPPSCVAATIKKYPESLNHLLPEIKRIIKKAEESIVKPETELVEDAGQESVVLRGKIKPVMVEKAEELVQEGEKTAYSFCSECGQL